MICKVIKLLAILCALAGCSVVQQKVEMDASTAATIAAVSGDTAGLLQSAGARGRDGSDTDRAHRSPPGCSCIC